MQAFNKCNINLNRTEDTCNINNNATRNNKNKNDINEVIYIIFCNMLKFSSFDSKLLNTYQYR